MKYLVLFVKGFKSTSGLKTHHIENTFVLTTLLATAYFFGKSWVEYLGVYAVWFSFQHASISNRLEEREHWRKRYGHPVQVDCYDKLSKFFYAKEILWFAYFALNGSYSALVGVIIFLLYGYWRTSWRKYNPIK